jgi:hypothetical protein
MLSTDFSRRSLSVLVVNLTNLRYYLSWYSDQATGWTAGAGFPTGRDFSLLHNVQTGSGAYPASYPVGTGGDFPGVRRPGRETDHSPRSSAEVNKNDGAIPPLPRMSSWHSA